MLHQELNIQLVLLVFINAGKEISQRYLIFSRLTNRVLTIVLAVDQPNIMLPQESQLMVWEFNNHLLVKHQIQIISNK